MDSIEKRLIRLNGTQAEEYASLVEAQIRKRYSVSAELAILRRRDSKPEEFAEYDAYAEECKKRAKEDFGIEGGEEA
jgi:proline dehydrogenase